MADLEKRRLSSKVWAVTGAASFALISACIWFYTHGTRMSGNQSVSKEAMHHRDHPGEPYREVSKDGLIRVVHSDANGQAPLEHIQTPQGTVIVQRTFKADGTLLKEECFLNGKAVPYPGQR